MKLEIGGHVVELREYLTGGQDMELRKMQLQASKVTGFDAATQEAKLESDLSVDVDIQKRAIEMLVVSFDGEEAEASKKVFDLPLAEFQIVADKVEELRGKKKS